MERSNPSQFLEKLKRCLAQRGVVFRLVGGQAAIFYRYAEFTKDVDVSIPSSASGSFLLALNELSPELGRMSYRIGIGAPLDPKWGNKGWTSHFELVEAGSRDRVDVFLRLPRVEYMTFGGDSQVGDLHVLAETKKTQREKDWDFVRAFGLRMIEDGDSRGFLHLFDSEVLLTLAQSGAFPPEQIIIRRPSLRLITEDPSKLEAALLIERLFWQKWDAKRLKCYLTAGRKYLSAVQGRRESLQALDLLGQHDELVEIAEQYLPPDPFSILSVESIVDSIISDLFPAFPNKFRSYLPNLIYVKHADGIYNADIV